MVVVLLLRVLTLTRIGVMMQANRRPYHIQIHLIMMMLSQPALSLLVLALTAAAAAATAALSSMRAIRSA